MSVMSTQSQLSKIFSFDEILLRHKVYQRSFRYMLRRASEPTSREPQSRSVSPTNMSALEMRDSCERSARLDSMLKADAEKKGSQLKVLTLGPRRSTLAKQLRSQLGPLFQEHDLHHYRKEIVQILVVSLLNIVEAVETKSTGFVTTQSRQHVERVRLFVATAAPDWEVTDDVSAAASGLWRHWLVQQTFHLMTTDPVTAL